MKATFDLPDDLVRQLKLRAARDGRKLKEIAAALLRDGLGASPDQRKATPPLVRKDRKTGLPVIQCRRAASPAEELTPKRIAKILSEQEVEWSS
jgi:plasmid stability protein